MLLKNARPCPEVFCVGETCIIEIKLLARNGTLYESFGFFPCVHRLIVHARDYRMMINQYMYNVAFSY